jgi:hypothetical protein
MHRVNGRKSSVNVEGRIATEIQGNELEILESVASEKCRLTVGPEEKSPQMNTD